MKQDKNSAPPSENVNPFLSRLSAPANREKACQANNPEEFREWQAEARPLLCSLLGLDLIQQQAATHSPSVECGKALDCGDYFRQGCTIETEPDAKVFFWLLKPKKTSGKSPLAITPHGHDPKGPDTSAGIPQNDKHAQKIRDEDRDVAVQAVQKGFVAIAPATRGLAPSFVTDTFEHFEEQD